MNSVFVLCCGDPHEYLDLEGSPASPDNKHERESKEVKVETPRSYNEIEHMRYKERYIWENPYKGVHDTPEDVGVVRASSRSRSNHAERTDVIERKTRHRHTSNVHSQVRERTPRACCLPTFPC